MHAIFTTPPGMITVQVQALARGLPNPRYVHQPHSPELGEHTVHAGTVQSIGKGASRFEKGDRVITIASSKNTSCDGTGSLEVLAEENISCRVPNGFSFEQACLIGLSLAAAGKALFHAPGLGLARTAEAEKFVLVSGGDTSVGFMATQLLTMAGYKPIVTCSTGNRSMCEAYGAAAVFDEEASGVGADIRVFTDNKLDNVIDCIADAATTAICYGAIGSFGGSYVALKAIDTAVKYKRRDVRAYPFVADDLFDRHYRSAETKQLDKQLVALLETWLRDEVARPGHLGSGPNSAHHVPSLSSFDKPKVEIVPAPIALED